MVTEQLLLPVSVPFTCVNMPHKCTVCMHKHIGYCMQSEQAKHANCTTPNAVQHVSNVA